MVGAADEWTSLLGGANWGGLMAVMAVGMVVAAFATLRTKRGVKLGRAHGASPTDRRWLQTRLRLEQGAATPAKEASDGPQRIRGRLVSSDGALGGPPEHACVYRNRATGDPATAIGSTTVFLADPSGKVAIENVERARIVAPVREVAGRETVELRIGDEVDAYGLFEAEAIDAGSDAPSEDAVYGTLGARGPLEVHVRRSALHTTTHATPTDDRPD